MTVVGIATWADVPVTADHAAHLDGAAITPAVALAAGIRSVTQVDQLPEWARAWDAASDMLPAIVFPWRSPSGAVVDQVRPDRPISWGGEEHKYLWPKGAGSLLLAGRVDDAAETILIVEGTKQTFAAASWAPEGVAVYGIGGCRNWTSDGVPLGDLALVEGRKVVVALDADVSINIDVYSAGERLRDALEMEGAGSIAFARNPGAGSTGLDDVLAGRAEGTRTAFITRLIALAKPKPADRRPPSRKARAARPRPIMPEVDPGRPVIDVDGDRLLVINELSRVLLERWNAERLFSHGGLLSQLRGREMSPITKPVFCDILQETALTGRYSKARDGEEIAFVPGWPDALTIDATMSRASLFAPLVRVAGAPFVRLDGSICQTPGYDDASSTMLVMDDRLAALQVPEAPTDSEVSLARKLIMEECLGDFPFPAAADRANALALFLTPFVRGHMDLVPLAVVDGLQMGVGKNLIADVISIVAVGSTTEPLPWPGDDEERRKLITSAFRSGADLFVFDEAHHLEGSALARALTSITYKDRQLGGNTMLGYPNRVTWVSLGNTVRVEGDVTRRVYRIALRPATPNPQDRPASSFRHGDYEGGLRGWTRDHRAELVHAALTLIRAWFARGCPPPTRGVSFGSFERWERVLGGIVETAGVPGFLANLQEWRSESNFDTRYWEAHVRWLRRTFGEAVFSCAQVRAAMIRDTDHEHPPGLPVDPAASAGDFNRKLGQAYAKQAERFHGGLQLMKAPEGMHGHTAGWMVIAPPESDVQVTTNPDDGPDFTGGTGGTGGTTTPTHVGGKNYVPASPVPHDAHIRAHVEPGADVPPVPPVPPVEPQNAEEPDATSQTDVLELIRTAPPPNDPVTRNAIEDGAEIPTLFDVDVHTSTQEPAEYTRVDWTRPQTFASPVELPAGVVAFDIETGSSDQLWRTGPEFLRLIATQHGARVGVSPNVGDALRTLRQARVIVGHNVMGFDLIALARHYKLDIIKLAEEGRVFDTMLAAVLTDPPEGNPKPAQVMKLYSLDNLAGRRLGDGAGKSHDLKALAREWGGFDKIPTDDARYVEYVAHDTVLAAQLAAGMKTNPYVKREHRIAALAAQIRMNGFRVDLELLGARLTANRIRRAELLAELTERYGLPATKKDGKPSKSPHATEEGKAAIVRAFADLGVDLPRTPKGNPSFGHDALVQVVEAYSGDERIAALVDVVSSLNGIRSVYETVQRCRIDDRVHPDITMFQASGRWSTTEPGLTVMGKRGGKYHEREVFVPEPGHVMIAADLAQVDARVVAAFSQDQAYMDLFEPGRDSHTEIALAVWGDAGRRDDAKVIGHGWNYGMGLDRLARQCGSRDAAEQFNAAMRERFSRLVAWKREVYEHACGGGLLDNGFGRQLRCAPGREFTQAPALMGQGGARDVMMEGLLRLPAELRPMLRAVIHDEVVLSVPADQVEDIERALVDAMSFEWCPYPDGRPIRITAGLGERRGVSWGHIYEK
jgi:DNA polymerase I-like protein with 3'-5' exonuclease and polymerase domains